MSRKVHMKVKGMRCEGCAQGLKGALESLPQVLHAEAAYPEQTAVVVWSSDDAHEDALREAAHSAGFQVTSFDE